MTAGHLIKKKRTEKAPQGLDHSPVSVRVLLSHHNRGSQASG